jgi:hypothetical protein
MKKKKELKEKYLTIRIPKDIEESLKLQAHAETRTVSGQALYYIKLGLSFCKR